MSNEEDKAMVSGGGEQKKQRTQTVSGEELKRKLEQTKKRRREEQAEKAAQRAPRSSLLRMGATAVAVTVGLGLLGVTMGTAGSHEDAVMENSDRITQLKESLGEEKKTADSAPDPEVMQAAMTSAANRGRELADVQNALADMGDMTTDEAKLAEYGRRTDDNKRFFTQGAVSRGDFLPHGMWYQPNEPGINSDNRPAWVPVAPDSWEWTFVPTWEVGTDGVVPVIWEARFTGGESNGQLLAWVVGKYDSRRELFSEMRLGHTPEGFERIGATTSPEAFGAHRDELIAPPEQSEIIDSARAAVEAEDKQREGEERDRRREELRNNATGEGQPPAEGEVQAPEAPQEEGEAR